VQDVHHLAEGADSLAAGRAGGVERGDDDGAVTVGEPALDAPRDGRRERALVRGELHEVVAPDTLTEDGMADSETYRRGAEVRRRLQGDAWVDTASKTTYADPVMRTFIDVVTETVFGGLWTRPGLDLKTRTLICVVSDAATGHEAELAIHLRMALRQGWTEEQLAEALLHLLGYVGAPAARDALLVASRVFAEVRGERA
jgi:4-carboxymuconolactone decarboxylase